LAPGPREFAFNQEEIYSRIRQHAEQQLAAYDVEVESRRIIDNAMRVVLHSFGLGLGLGLGALELGYLLTTVVSSTAVDVTGLTAATMLLVTSFLILPYKRSKAKTEFQRRIGCSAASAAPSSPTSASTRRISEDRVHTKLTTIEAESREIFAAVEKL